MSVLDEERQSLGERWLRQGCFCSFEELIAEFGTADIQGCLTDAVQPLFGV